MILSRCLTCAAPLDRTRRRCAACRTPLPCVVATEERTGRPRTIRLPRRRSLALA